MPKPFFQPLCLCWPLPGALSQQNRLTVTQIHHRSRHHASPAGIDDSAGKMFDLRYKLIGIILRLILTGQLQCCRQSYFAQLFQQHLTNRMIRHANTDILAFTENPARQC